MGKSILSRIYLELERIRGEKITFRSSASFRLLLYKIVQNFFLFFKGLVALCLIYFSFIQLIHAYIIYSFINIRWGPSPKFGRRFVRHFTLNLFIELCRRTFGQLASGNTGWEPTPISQVAVAHTQVKPRTVVCQNILAQTTHDIKR